MSREPVLVDSLDFIPHENGKFLILEGSESEIGVSVSATARGYLWFVCKHYGHGATLDDAKTWARTVTEQLAAPANQRCMQGLGKTPAVIKKMNIA